MAKAVGTVLQEKTAQIYANGLLKGERVSIKDAMLEAGYAESCARQRSITKTVSWRKLIDKYLDETKLAKTHVRLLSARKIDTILLSDSLSDDEIEVIMGKVDRNVLSIKDEGNGKKLVAFSEPHYEMWDKALDKAYKIRSKYAPEKLEITKREFSDKSPEELKEIIEAEYTEFKKPAPKEGVPRIDSVEEANAQAQLLT